MKEPPIKPLTRFTVILCAFLFGLSIVTTPLKSAIPVSPVKIALLYDWPEAYALNLKIPYWEGFYQQIVLFFKEGKTVSINAPLFEKIKEGEIWRLLTPIYLHADIFHLLFNMAWVIIIGRQLESRMGSFKTFLFILITAIFSNTAQYLMSGPNFVGYSGVLCGMFAFIWWRKKQAPWEEYDLDPSTAQFILFFILGIFSIQLIAFLISVFSNSQFSPNIANTAHITGGLMGLFLATFPYFARKDSTYPL